MILIKPA